MLTVLRRYNDRFSRIFAHDKVANIFSYKMYSLKYRIQPGGKGLPARPHAFGDIVVGVDRALFRAAKRRMPTENGRRSRAGVLV